MTELYLDIFVMICFGLIAWGIIKVERIYQYPFFMGAIFLAFIAPQAFALVNNPSPASSAAVERVLLMSCLCVASCAVGYALPVNTKWLVKWQIDVDERRLSRAAFVLMAIAYLFWFLLLRQAQIGIATADNSNWTGPATIYAFFAQGIYIAFAIFLLQSLKHPKLTNILYTAISGYIPLLTVLAGRRQPTLTFLAIIGFSIFAVYRLKPSRWMIILGIIALIFVIPLMGAIRWRFWDMLFAGQWQELLDIAQKEFADLQSGNTLELRNAALLMDAVAIKSLYGLGSGWWDAIIFQYVPGQIVGFQLKQSLQFNVITDSTLYELYGYYIPSGTTITGPADSFLEFGYLGCLFYGILGYIYKHLWLSSYYQKSMFSHLVYVCLISPSMVGVTHGVSRFVQEAIFRLSVVSIIIYYSRIKSQKNNQLLS